MLPLVSVIVTNFNGEKYLRPCFEALKAQTYPSLELIMADDGSNDGSVAFMKENYPEVLLSVNKVNSGLSVSSNNAAHLAHGEYLLFFNNDTTAFPNLVEELVKKAESDKSLGVVGGVGLPYRPEDDSSMREHQKDLGVGSDIYGYVCLAKDAGHIFYPDACILIRRSIFYTVGQFDPDFFLYGEDMDLCWRVQLLGFKVAIAKEAKFRHDSFCNQLEGGRFKTSYRRRLLVERQVINKIFKYYQIPTLLWLVPKFFFYYLAESLYFLVIKRDLRMFFDVYLEAIIWNVTKARSILRNREFIQKIRRRNDTEILNLMYPKYRKLEVVRMYGVPHIN